MNNRIKELRKILGLSQDEFGKSLGVTRTAVCAWEIGNRNVTEQVKISICKAYNVNRIWLNEGIGNIFSNISETPIDKLTKIYGLTDNEKELVLDFCTLSSDDREKFVQFLRH